MNSKSNDITLNAESGNVNLHSSSTEVDSILIYEDRNQLKKSNSTQVKIIFRINYWIKKK